MTSLSLCLIIPCFNEAHRVSPHVFIEFCRAHPFVNILFVNDGSTDNTLTLLKSIATQHGSIDYIDLCQNQGKAEAVRQGVQATLDQGFTHIGYWDADLATPLGEIDEFVRVLTANPHVLCVSGARIARLGSAITRKWYRHYLGRVFATVVSLILQLPVYDTQCGAKIFAADLARTIFKDAFVSRWIFDVELFARITRTEYFAQRRDIMYELPLREWRDVAGSRLKLIDFLKAPWQLVKIHRHYTRLWKR